MTPSGSAPRHVDYLAIASLFTISALVANLILVALCNPATQGFVGGAIVGIGSAGLILYRQLRKANRSLIASEAKARYVATHDELTQLPNRAMFAEYLAAIGRAAADSKAAPLVMCIRLDRDFSDGDCPLQSNEIVRHVAAQLATVCGKTDLLARLGERLFAIACPASDPGAAQALAGAVERALAPVCETSSGPVPVTVSMGLSLRTSRTKNALEVLTEAQTALVQAVAQGGGHVCFFEAGTDKASQARKSLEIELCREIAEGTLKMAYQPQVNAKGVTTGVEALIRWSRPGQGDVSPSVFMPLAESCGLGAALGAFALKQAFLDSRRWPGLCVAVNISGLQIRGDLVATLKTLLAQTGADPRHLELEIPEAALVNEQPDTRRTLEDIRKLGFSIALDDFGTGYSSLSYLRRFPVDKIKIDKSFVAQLGKQSESGAIIEAILEMGAALDLKIIAEGIETRAQSQSLLAAGCSLFQGPLFCRPVEAAAIDDLIAAPVKMAA